MPLTWNADTASAGLPPLPLLQVLPPAGLEVRPGQSIPHRGSTQTGVGSFSMLRPSMKTPPFLHRDASSIDVHIPTVIWKPYRVVDCLDTSIQRIRNCGGLLDRGTPPPISSPPKEMGAWKPHTTSFANAWRLRTSGPKSLDRTSCTRAAPPLGSMCAQRNSSAERLHFCQMPSQTSDCEKVEERKKIVVFKLYNRRTVRLFDRSAENFQEPVVGEEGCVLRFFPIRLV